MSDVESFRPQMPSLSMPSFDRFDTRLNRHVRREVALIEARVPVRQAAIDAAADVQRTKIDALASTGGYAMQRAALVAQMEQQLALACPTASGDLDYLKTLTTVGIGQVVVDTASKVNRL
ncbi:hypothetical protein [Mycobacteroides abscessus]|uniref:hypothetical protein n=1 Tax=Mycobacteroides abscessus TaxID=36809 RepID=UPI002103DC2D|nr:hypothetical protein [Mycobacteroides abscessus]